MTVTTKRQLSIVEKREQLNLDGLQDLFQVPRLSKPEMHLLLKPFFLMDRHADRFKPIEHVYSVVENGKAVTRGWTVQPHFKYGLPGPFDRDVTITIYQIVSEEYFSKRVPVPRIMPIGTLRGFSERMGIAPSGQNIAAIKESLRRLKNTLADCEETFFDNKKHRYLSLSFRLLQGVGFAGEDSGNGTKHEENFVVFDDAILRNLNTGYVTIVDLDCYQSLRTNIAKQLYTHLSYRFFVEAKDGEDSWTVDYGWLSIHLGVKSQTELRYAKHQLKTAHDELKQLGYIADYKWDGWRIVYRPGHVWRGEQLRRKSGKARQPIAIKAKPERQSKSAEPVQPHDRFLPALVAFASGLAIGADKLKALGLTTEDAIALCQERGIALRNP